MVAYDERPLTGVSSHLEQCGQRKADEANSNYQRCMHLLIDNEYMCMHHMQHRRDADCGDRQS